jgi:hypothetical protein
MSSKTSDGGAAAAERTYEVGYGIGRDHPVLK